MTRISVSVLSMDAVQVGPGKTATLTCEMTGVEDDAPLTVAWLKGADDQVTSADEPGLTMSTSGKRYIDHVRITSSILIEVTTKCLITI